MDQKVIVPVEAVLTKCVSLPVGYVPTPRRRTASTARMRN
ncbi:Uncharacterised protein [Janthinobacterium lividum]|nr:Uncharacterised protein [Janthinobacterium lividum]